MKTTRHTLAAAIAVSALLAGAAPAHAAPEPYYVQNANDLALVSDFGVELNCQSVFGSAELDLSRSTSYLGYFADLAAGDCTVGPWFTVTVDFGTPGFVMVQPPAVPGDPALARLDIDEAEVEGNGCSFTLSGSIDVWLMQPTAGNDGVLELVEAVWPSGYDLVVANAGAGLTCGGLVYDGDVFGSANTGSQLTLHEA